MSEANNAWTVGSHQVEVEHSTMTGKIEVTLDGKDVGEGRMLAKKQEIDFTVDDQDAKVSVQFAYGGFAAKSELHVAGKYVEPMSR